MLSVCAWRGTTRSVLLQCAWNGTKYTSAPDVDEAQEGWIDAFLKEREKVEHDLNAGIVSQVNIVDGSFEEQQRLRTKRKYAAKNYKMPKGVKSPKGVKKGMTTKRK